MMAGTGATGVRKWHRKSRNGCKSCKSRKVKCDENHPSCHNCLQRGIRCDYLESDTSSTGSPPPAIQDSSLELELLHNYTISTAATLTKSPLIRDMWRVVVPQIGFGTRYILDGILALSALHMARSDARRRDVLLAAAAEYLTASLREALPLISAVNAQNCSVLFLFSVITLYVSLAMPKRDDDMLVVGDSGVPQWLYLFRGIEPIIEVQQESVLSSPVSLIFMGTHASSEYWHAHEPGPHDGLDELEAGIQFRTSSDIDKQDVLMHAIHALRRSYTFLDSRDFGEEHKLRGMYQWLLEISDAYLALLRGLDREALCVFAFFCVLTRDFETFWWSEGWPAHLIKRVYLLLDDEYRLYIRWPIEQIGWVPPPMGMGTGMAMGMSMGMGMGQGYMQ
ncbi:hypothetical protein B0T11DRAFT_356877 [Plectosphaerella cucumerina]|uniref:Zn(2)-C6 fungal-type domain-containing protein n=1 Tax=Plectosphaerella cucumerina TaxID=40658 RepID=A0A8K0X045_9PEZI|nr:hypothetical protein B0T11DRAFT_356877 [Plectosphaerella cucumerina]